jgi:hypothetical protein
VLHSGTGGSGGGGLLLLDVTGPWVDAYFKDAVRCEYKQIIVSYDLWEYLERKICD